MFEPMDIIATTPTTINTSSSNFSSIPTSITRIITPSNPKSPVAVGLGGSDEIETTTPTTKIHSSTTTAHPLSFTNGALKRHHHHATKTKSVVSYKECLKNHAASLGGHALDGCGEFMPSPNSVATNPSSLKCAACGCHRNFHRRDPDDVSSPSPITPPPISTRVIEYQPHHRHHPPPPPPPRGNSPSPQSPSPPPISSSYYPASAPHMLLALSAGLQTHGPAVATPTSQPPLTAAENSHIMMRCGGGGGDGSGSSNGRKRFRTKFSQGQKIKMLEFAERVGWKMMKRDEEVVGEFCSEIGVDRNVLKVWMHNNKSKSVSEHHPHHQFHVNGGTNNNQRNNSNGDDEDTNPHLATNGSSSSS